jgi:hypothetical protein
MPTNSRIHEVFSISRERNQKEENYSLITDISIKAVFAPRKAWLQMLNDQSSESLKLYKEVFWFMPDLLMFPMEWTQRSFAGYIACQQCITGSLEQQTAANLSLLRAGSDYETPVYSIERAMDIAIGADVIGADVDKGPDRSWSQAAAA